MGPSPGTPGGNRGPGPIDLADDAVAARVVAIQRGAYRIEADLIGFDGIPPLHEGIADVRAVDLSWSGRWEGVLLVGIMAWAETDDGCEIDRLAVHPEHLRRGHGRALIGAVLHHPRVSVSTGTANLPALALYESLGFLAVAERSIAPGVTVTDLLRVS